MSLTQKRAALATQILRKKRGDLEKVAELEAEVAKLREKLAHYEQLEMAEQLMMSAAQRNPELLSELVPTSVPEFIAKRAQLAMMEGEELSKTAQLVQFAPEYQPGHTKVSGYNPREEQHQSNQWGADWGSAGDDRYDDIDMTALIEGGY